MRNLALPEEILLEIFRHLKLCDLATCQLVCRRFFELIRTTPALLYLLELQVQGFEDVASSIPLYEKVQLLQAYAWFWTADRIPFMSTFTCPKEIVFGSYALSSTIFAYTPDQKHIELNEIPSKVFGVKSRLWTLGPFPYDIYAFAVDGAQRLLVLVTWSTADTQDVTIHLLDSETGKPHPHATSPHYITWRAVHSEDEEWPVQRCNIQIHSDMIGAVFGLWTEEFECEVILAFNWKTGEKLLDARATASPGFAFVNERYILVAALHANCRSLVVIDMEHPPPLGYDFSETADDKTLPQPLLSFDFPESLSASRHGYGIVDEAIWGSCTHAYPKSAAPPFLRTTDEDVIVLHYQPICPDSCTDYCDFSRLNHGTRWLVLSKPEFIRMIEGPLDETESGEEDGLLWVSWKVWGKCVRKFDTCGLPVRHPVHGSRFFAHTTPSLDPFDGQPDYITLCDFRTLPLRRDPRLVFRTDSPEVLDGVELNQPYHHAILPLEVSAERPLTYVAMVGEYFMIIYNWEESTEEYAKYHIVSV